MCTCAQILKCLSVHASPHSVLRVCVCTACYSGIFVWIRLSNPCCGWTGQCLLFVFVLRFSSRTTPRTRHENSKNKTREMERLTHCHCAHARREHLWCTICLPMINIKEQCYTHIHTAVWCTYVHRGSLGIQSHQHFDAVNPAHVTWGMGIQKVFHPVTPQHKSLYPGETPFQHANSPGKNAL